MMTLPHLETNITIACNNSCVACNHFVPLQRKQARASMVTPEGLLSDLTNLGRVARAAKYAFIGGEPTLHPGLRQMVDVARAVGIADELEIWTNGQTLRGNNKLNGWFWWAFDRVVVSAYPGKLTDDDLQWMADAANEAGVKFEVKDERKQPYFTRLLESEPTDEARTRAKYRRCWYRTYCHVLDHGAFYRCCTSPFIPEFVLGQPNTDGIPVEGITEEALRAFLGQEEPMDSCRVCAGHGAEPVAWVEIREPVAWVEASR